MNSKIGLIYYGAERPKSGITRYTEELIAALQRCALSLTVLQTGNYPRRIGRIPLRGSVRVPGLLTLGQAEIAWITRHEKLSLVHDATGLIPLCLTQTRLIATIHDVIPYIHPETSTRLDWLIQHFWLPTAVRRLDQIITPSLQSKSDIVRFFHVNPEKVTVVPHGVDPRYQPLDQGKTNPILRKYEINFPYILYVSAVEPRNKRKNLASLLEAYADLRRWSKHWRLVIVGSYRKHYRPLLEVMERFGLGPSDVHFTGFVPEEDLPAIYNRADLFILPSLYEGFGFPVLEAMSCGTPVITSDRSSLPEVAGEGALLIDPNQVEAITEAMQRVLSDPDLANEYRAKGLSQARKFSWERAAQETIAVYKGVLS